MFQIEFVLRHWQTSKALLPNKMFDLLRFGLGELFTLSSCPVYVPPCCITNFYQKTAVIEHFFIFSAFFHSQNRIDTISGQTSRSSFVFFKS